MEAGSIFLAGVDDGRISLGAHLAFRGDVGDFVFCVGTSGDGGSAWLEQFRFHADGMEKGSRVLRAIDDWIADSRLKSQSRT